MLLNKNNDTNKYRIKSRKLYRYNNCGLQFVIMEYLGRKSHENIFKIKFIKSGYETVSRLGDINNGAIMDFMNPSVCGIGYYGKEYKKLKKEDSELVFQLYKRWLNMIHRCYNKNIKSYKNYGYMGIYVSDRWLNFSNYYKDVIKLPGYDRDLVLLNKLELDKDKLQKGIKNKVYSKDTCCWISCKEQFKYIDYSKIDRTKNIESTIKTCAKYFVSIDKNGIKTINFNISKYARDNNMSQTHISQCLLGKRKTHKNMKFRYATNNEIEKYKLDCSTTIPLADQPK